MEVKVDHDRKLVEFWLTKADQEDVSLGEYLRQQYRVCKEKNYMVAQFRSGTEDLYGLTRELLLYNRKRAAQVEIQKEKTGKNPNLSTSYCPGISVQ